MLVYGIKYGSQPMVQTAFQKNVDAPEQQKSPVERPSHIMNEKYYNESLRICSYTHFCWKR
jgi:hypothetical protein